MYSWDIARPDEITCKFCGLVYPNAKFPMDRTLTGTNALGETVTYQYHLEEKTGMRYMFADHAFLYKRTWIIKQCTALGRAYHVTRNPEYARRAVLILDRCAEVYSHYPVMRQWIRTFEFAKSQNPPYPSAGGKWGRWMYDELSQGPIDAYDLVYDSNAFATLSARRGYDVRKRFETDFIRARFDYVNTFNDHASNMAPFYLRPAIRAGKVIAEPKYVHWAYRWLLEILGGRCYFDGMWNEAPSYHYQTMGGLARAFDEMRGYSDPPGFVDPVDGKRFDDLDPDTDIAFFARAKDAPAAIGFPNGRICPVHDSWASSEPSQAREETVSAICPGFGHAVLGRGRGVNQIQAHLHFSAANGHCHYDNLNLTLFAKGRELLSDIGYTWTQGRYWATSSVGHNLVVVDRSDQQYRKSDGDLLWYFPDNRGVAVVEADGKRGYANIEGLDRYRRLLVMIPVSDADTYVVDISRTRGGTVHDWLLHGDADRDMTATCSVQLTPRPGDGTMLEPGEEWAEPVDEGSRFNCYGAIRQVRTGGTFVTDMRYVDEPERGIRIHLLGHAATDVFLGVSPSIRRAGVGANGDYRKTFDFWMPQLVARRSAEPDKALASTFVAIEEPVVGRPVLTRVTPVAVTPATPDAVAFEVAHGDAVDTIVSTLDEPPFPERVIADGSIRVKGRLAVVRQVAGEVVGIWLFEGESVRAPGLTVSPAASRYAGTIRAAMRKADRAEYDAFVVDGDLPDGDMLHGHWMIVTHGNGLKHGYEIDRVEKSGGGRLVVLRAAHGLRIDGDRTEEVFFPRRKISGINTFTIPIAAAIARESVPVAP